MFLFSFLPSSAFSLTQHHGGLVTKMLSKIVTSLEFTKFASVDCRFRTSYPNYISLICCNDLSQLRAVAPIAL